MKVDSSKLPPELEVAGAVLCKRWKLSILWLLLAGCERFSDLAQRLPAASAKMLAAQLRELEDDGLSFDEKANGVAVIRLPMRGND